MNPPNHDQPDTPDTSWSALPTHPLAWELTTNPVQQDDHDPPNPRSPESPANPSAVESRKATRLFGRAQDAAAVRNYQTHPDVAALNIERWRARCNALIWVGVLFFLGWTTPNVQQFVAGDAAPLSPVWLTGWFVEPAIALPLMGILWAEQVAGRYGVRLAGWPRFTKWFALSATYSMNTWPYWAGLDARGIVVHSIPPLMVFAFAEVLPIVRERMTTSMWAARSDAIRRQSEDESDHDGETGDPVSDRIVATAARVAQAIRARPAERTDPVRELPAAEYEPDPVSADEPDPVVADGSVSNQSAGGFAPAPGRSGPQTAGGSTHQSDRLDEGEPGSGSDCLSDPPDGSVRSLGSHRSMETLRADMRESIHSGVLDRNTADRIVEVLKVGKARARKLRDWAEAEGLFREQAAVSE